MNGDNQNEERKGEDSEMYTDERYKNLDPRVSTYCL